MERIVGNSVSRLAIALLFLTLLAAMVGQPISVAGLKLGSNFRVTSDPLNRQQVEPSVAIHLKKPNIVVVGANDMRLFEGPFLPTGWAGIYRSTDGGRTWTNSLIPGFPGDNSPEGLASPLRDFTFFFDAVVAFDSKGNLFYAGIVMNPSPLFFLPIQDGTLFLAKYVNDGAKFDSVMIVRRGSGQSPFIDKPWLFVDPANDNIYLSWTEFISGGAGVFDRMMFTRSVDGGKTFSEPVAISEALMEAQGSPAIGQCSWIAAHGGVVYVIWISYLSFFGQIGRILLAKSTNGGLSFTSPKEVVQSPFLFFAQGQSFRTPCGASVVTDETANKVFVAWTDWSTGDLEILYKVSTDGGNSFSDSRRLNEVSTNHQFFAMADFSAGRLHVAWYDARFDEGGPIEKLDVFYATSDDFGQTFTPNIRVTSVSFNPSLLAYLDGTAAFIGDYFGLDARGRTVQIAWTDNRNVGPGSPQNSDIFTARITL